MTFLRRVLAVDAISAAASALLLLVAAGALSPMLGLRQDLLFAAGAIFVPFAALVSWTALQRTPPRMWVWVIIALNVAWVVASAGLLLSGIERPNLFGYIFVIAQAVAVGVLAELEYVGLKRMAATV